MEDNDAEAIKEMFAEEVKTTIDLDTQINEMIEYFDGEVIYYDKIRTVAGGEAYDEGILTYSRIGKSPLNDPTSSN